MTPHVLILGGGFAGLAAARALAKAPVRVTLLDRTNHHVFQPLLYQVATANLAPSDIAEPLRHILREQRNATVLLAEISREQAETKGATGRATVERSGNGTYRVVAIADKGKGRFDAGQDRAFTPIGRMVLPAGSFERFEAVKRALPNGAELDDVPVLQQLAGEGALAGALTEARFFDVGVPEGYREAVTAFPATAP